MWQPNEPPSWGLLCRIWGTAQKGGSPPLEDVPKLTRAARSVALAKNIATVRGTRMKIENSVGTHSLITYNREKEI